VPHVVALNCLDRGDRFLHICEWENSLSDWQRFRKPRVLQHNRPAGAAQQGQAETAVSLTDAQRQEISDLRKQYDAKIAEKDIMLQADIRQLMQRRPPQEVLAAAQELREKFQHTKKALQEELEAKIVTVRSRA